MIGVTLKEIDTETAKGLGLPDARGALINDVSPGSAGDKAGLRIGDVVRSIDGTEVRQSSDLPPIVGAMAPGTKTTLGILRDGKRSEEHTSELQSLMRSSYAVFCLKKKKTQHKRDTNTKL